MRLRRLQVHLYNDPASKTLRINELSDYLEARLGVRVDTRPEFFSFHGRGLGLDELARSLAKARVTNPFTIVDERREPLYGEVVIEKEVLSNPGRRLHGVMYDCLAIRRVMASLIRGEERNLERHVHIVLTSRLLGEFSREDGRYHVRTIVCSFPTIISTSGLVEGPAKPREYYLALRSAYSLGLGQAALEPVKERLRGGCLDYDDERLTEVLKGYVMQAVLYFVTGEPFCSSVNCRLYNAHWQEELVQAQLSGDRYCGLHSKLIDSLRNDP